MSSESNMPKTKKIKYLFTALGIILLFAIIGIALNYELYLNLPGRYIKNIFGEENICVIHEKYYYAEYESGEGWGDSVKLIPLQRDIKFNYSEQYPCYSDKESYSNTEKVVVTIENHGRNSVVNSGNYVLETKIGDNWYVIHTGDILAKKNTWVCESGGSKKITLDLQEQGEINELQLKKGSYRFSINVKNIMEVSTEAIAELIENGIWLACEFEIV